MDDDSRPRKRIEKTACLRCHEGHTACNDFRPCTNCSRAGVPCVECPEDRKRRKANLRLKTYSTRSSDSRDTSIHHSLQLQQPPTPLHAPTPAPTVPPNMFIPVPSSIPYTIESFVPAMPVVWTHPAHSLTPYRQVAGASSTNNNVSSSLPQSYHHAPVASSMAPSAGEVGQGHSEIYQKVLDKPAPHWDIICSISNRVRICRNCQKSDAKLFCLQCKDLCLQCHVQTNTKHVGLSFELNAINLVGVDDRVCPKCKQVRHPSICCSKEIPLLIITTDGICCMCIGSRPCVVCTRMTTLVDEDLKGFKILNLKNLVVWVQIEVLEKLWNRMFSSGNYCISPALLKETMSQTMAHQLSHQNAVICFQLLIEWSLETRTLSTNERCYPVVVVVQFKHITWHGMNQVCFVIVDRKQDTCYFSSWKYSELGGLKLDQGEEQKVVAHAVGFSQNGDVCMLDSTQASPEVLEICDRFDENWITSPVFAANIKSWIDNNMKRSVYSTAAFLLYHLGMTHEVQSLVPEHILAVENRIRLNELSFATASASAVPATTMSMPSSSPSRSSSEASSLQVAASAIHHDTITTTTTTTSTSAGIQSQGLSNNAFPLRVGSLPGIATMNSPASFPKSSSASSNPNALPLPRIFAASVGFGTQHQASAAASSSSYPSMGVTDTTVDPSLLSRVLPRPYP